MIRRSFAWDNFRPLSALSGRWVDRSWLAGLFLVALPLFTVNLGGLPLRDWDEGIVAQVAREMWRSPFDSLTWLYPTLGGVPYLNKPPLLHWLISIAYTIGGVNEWTSRLPGALLTACSVPLLYGVGREIFPQRAPAIFATLVYLTLLPVVRHGRLAMLDGALLCFFLLLMLCLLRTRRNLRWGLGVGLAFGLLCLTKGVAALLLGAIAFTFVLWDTPRLLTSRYVWLGVLIGSAPVAIWYGTQLAHYGNGFIQSSLLSQSLSRIWTSVEKNGGAPWYYLIEILKYSMPWLLFVPWGLRSAWENRNMGWAKLVLVWSGGYLLVISLMSTKLPWYVLPVYPALALLTGRYLADVWDVEDFLGVRQLSRSPYPRSWSIVFGLLAIGSWAASSYFSGIGPSPQPDVQLILTALALTMTVATVLVIRRDSQFILVLIWGAYLSLLLLMASSQWIWELSERYPVKPVAELIRRNTLPGQEVLTSFPFNRPSLNFYSDRQVIPASTEEIKIHWHETPKPYVLVDQSTLEELNLDFVEQLGKAEEFILATRDSANRLLNLPKVTL